MHSILIVDDEKIERNGIRFLIKKLNIELTVYEEVNGKAALDFLEENTVDILLTDVKMPFIDGIELIKQAAPLYPDMKMIIFSGYSEFEYAKFAMKMGVTDYILKPVNPEEFSKTLTKVIDDLEERRLRKSLEEETMSFMKEHILYSLINGNSVEEVLLKAGKFVNLDAINNYGRMMLIETNDDFFARIGEAIGDIIKESIGANLQYLNMNPQQSILLYNQGMNIDYLRIAKNIVDILKDKYDEDAYIAIGDEFEEGARGLAREFDDLEELMENKFYQTSVHVYTHNNESDTNVFVQIDDDTLMKQMKQDIKMKDIGNLKKHFENLCEKYRNQTSFSQVYVKFIFSNLLKDFYGNLPNVNEQELDKEIDRLYCSTDFDSVMKIVNINIKRLEEAFAYNPQMLHREIESIKTYIYENYDKELSVDQLAEQVFMAPSYLSHVFKKETGQNLSKFIKSYRMEKAKEMLEETHNKIVNISYAVGYSNVSYFCQSFREYFGVSPQKFRDQGDADEGIS